MFMVPSGFRSLLTTGPGPDKGSSKKSQLRPHMPEKSGIDAAVAAASPADSTVCPKVGVAVAASVTNKRKFHSLRIPVSPRGLQKLGKRYSASCASDGCTASHSAVCFTSRIRETQGDCLGCHAGREFWPIKLILR